MAPGVAASKTKKEFFTHLNLIEGNEEDERLFRKMLVRTPFPSLTSRLDVSSNPFQDEAAAGRQRISQSAENLNLQYRHDPDVQPPYTYNQITETARHREILTIYRNAAVETRTFYNRGQFFEGPNEENWIIRWCLYHSFRYTDNRNRTRSRGRKQLTTMSNSSEEREEEEQIRSMGALQPGRPGTTTGAAFTYQLWPLSNSSLGLVDGNWGKQRLTNDGDLERRPYPQAMANNLRPRYGLPAGGFDSTRRAPPPIYEVAEKMCAPEAIQREVLRESSELHPLRWPVPGQFSSRRVFLTAPIPPGLKSRPRTTYWDPARSA